MNQTELPPMDEMCGNEQCMHNFGAHYTRYDGSAGGCSKKGDDQREGVWFCACRGFARIILIMPGSMGEAK